MYAGRPPFFRSLGRAMRGRCPSCGGRGLFRTWFAIRERCPTCGLNLEQGEGAFLGSMTINYTVASMAFFAFLAVWLWLTLPGVNTLALTLAGLGVVAAVLAAFFPLSKTLWAAFSLFLHDPADIDRRHQPPPAGH